MDAVAFPSLAAAFRREKILTCLIFQDDQLRVEHARSPKLRNRLQRLNSCTKSVISLLVGIALAEGLLPDIQAPLSVYFSDLLQTQSDPRKADLTLRHLLTMTDGLDWPEFGEWDCFAPMAYARNIPRFVLERPMVAAPGTVMNYNSGASHLLAAVLHQVTGGATLDFAEQRLFKPLGIRDYHWYLDAQGVPKGADGLRISTADMAKLGTLMLHDGCWAGRQVVPEAWVREATTPYMLTYEAIGAYGYHWWVGSLSGADPRDTAADDRFAFALGYGGQVIAVLPTHRTVVVITSELYQNSLRPLEILRTLIVPGLSRDLA